MRKIAIITEGLTEHIFLRSLIPILFGWENVSFRCVKLLLGQEHSVPYEHIVVNPHLYFLIIDVGGDNKVMTYIRDNEERLFNKGYEFVIGIRDMYSNAYRKRTKNEINESVNQSFIDVANSVIQGLSHSKFIEIHFAIMEIEAWFLSMYSLFEKLNEALTVQFIEDSLGFNIQTINPEVYFFHPSNEFSNIFYLIGRNYGKHRGQIEAFLSNLDETDLNTGIENNRCSKFAEFRKKLEEFG